MMSVVGFSHTATPAPPPADPFAANDIITYTPLSFFWGGAITDHIGAFAQLTYGGPPAASGIGGDPFVHAWGWDNTDVRYADSTSIGKMSITYGITANNNPTVQDPWNYHAGLAISLCQLSVSGKRCRVRSRFDHQRWAWSGTCRECRSLCLYQRSDLPRNLRLSHD